MQALGPGRRGGHGAPGHAPSPSQRTHAPLPRTPRMQVELTNVSIQLQPSKQCTPELVQQRVQGFQALLGGPDRFRTLGTTVNIARIKLPIPVIQTSTGIPGGWLRVLGPRCVAGSEPPALPSQLSLLLKAARPHPRPHASWRAAGMLPALPWHALAPCWHAHAQPCQPTAAVGMVDMGLENVNLTCTRLPEHPDWRAAPRQPIANASQLLAALAAQAATDHPGVGVLEIRSEIVLDEASIAGVPLPFNISGGRTLALVGGKLPVRLPRCFEPATGDGPDTLRCAALSAACPPPALTAPAAASESAGSIDVGAVSRLLVLKTGSVCILANISMAGAHLLFPFDWPQLGCTWRMPLCQTAANRVNGAGFGPLHMDSGGREWSNGTQTRMDPFPLFPTLDAAPGSTVRVAAGWCHPCMSVVWAWPAHATQEPPGRAAAHLPPAAMCRRWNSCMLRLPPHLPADRAEQQLHHAASQRAVQHTGAG